MAIAHRLVVERDGRYIPLAVADPDLLADMQARFRSRTEPLALAV